MEDTVYEWRRLQVLSLSLGFSLATVLLRGSIPCCRPGNATRAPSQSLTPAGSQKNLEHAQLYISDLPPHISILHKAIDAEACLWVLIAWVSQRPTGVSVRRNLYAPMSDRVWISAYVRIRTPDSLINIQSKAGDHKVPQICLPLMS